jgi:repressor LexA
VTSRQKEVFDFITNYIGKHGFAPSYEEIGYAVKVTSPGTVFNFVRRLKRDGHLTAVKSFGRSIKLTGACPMCGSRKKVTA